MKRKTPADYLRKGWTKGANAQSIGDKCEPLDYRADSWCLEGAGIAAQLSSLDWRCAVQMAALTELLGGNDYARIGCELV